MVLESSIGRRVIHRLLIGRLAISGLSVSIVHRLLRWRGILRLGYGLLRWVVNWLLPLLKIIRLYQLLSSCKKRALWNSSVYVIFINVDYNIRLGIENIATLLIKKVEYFVFLTFFP